MANSQRTGLTLLRLTGYSLLLLALFDFIALLIPIRVMDPAWELQTIGALVERVALPLIGFALVFGGGATQRSRAEFKLLQLLSTLAILVGVLYFLLLPLLVADTFRIESQFQQQIVDQVEQRKTQLAVIERRIQVVTDSEELERLAKRLNRQSDETAIQTQSPGQIKQQLLAQITQAKANVQNDVAKEMADRRLGLFKDSTKKFLSSLVAGFSFIYANRLTRWVQQPLQENRDPLLPDLDEWKN